MKLHLFYFHLRGNWEFRSIEKKGASFLRNLLCMSNMFKRVNIIVAPLRQWD